MSNVTEMAKFMLANPEKTREDFVKFATETFNASVSNARVYVYNASKRIEELGDKAGEARVRKNAKNAKNAKKVVIETAEPGIAEVALATVEAANTQLVAVESVLEDA